MNRSGIAREPFRPSRAPADQGAGNEGAGMGSREPSDLLLGHNSPSVPREASVMTDRQVNALAAFLAEGTSWDTPGIVAELRRQREHYDPWQLAAAMCKRASNPANTTPRLQPFDHEGSVACSRHPGAPTRTDGMCGLCFGEANAADYSPRPARNPVSHPLEAALARLDRRPA